MTTIEAIVVLIPGRHFSSGVTGLLNLLMQNFGMKFSFFKITID